MLNDRMNQQPTIGAYASIIDAEGRFVLPMGRVVGIGEKRIALGSCSNIFRRRSLIDAIQREGLKLVFLSAGERLPPEPIQPRDRLIARLAAARINVAL